MKSAGNEGLLGEHCWEDVASKSRETALLPIFSGLVTAARPALLRESGLSQSCGSCNQESSLSYVISPPPLADTSYSTKTLQAAEGLRRIEVLSRIEKGKVEQSAIGEKNCSIASCSPGSLVA